MGNCNSSSIKTIDDLTCHIIQNFVINYKGGCLASYGDKILELEYSGRNYICMNDSDFDEFLTSEDFLKCKSLKHKIEFKTLFHQLKEGLHNFGVIICAPDNTSIIDKSVSKDKQIDYFTDSSSEISEMKPASKKSKLSTSSHHVPIQLKCQPEKVVFKSLNSTREFNVKVNNVQGVHKFICWIENSFCVFNNVPIIKNIKGDQSLVLAVNSNTL